MNDLSTITSLIQKSKTKLNSLRDKDNDGYLEITLRDKTEIKMNLENIERLIKIVQRQINEFDYQRAKQCRKSFSMAKKEF